MNMDLVYGILAAVALSMILMFFQNLKRKKSWQGTVTDIQKIEDEDSDGFSHTHYRIYYQTDSGKQGKIDLRDSYYESHYPNLEIGARLIKVTGRDYPDLLH